MPGGDEDGGRGPAGPTVQRLLGSIIALGSELSLPVVLRRIVEAATELVDARYGALGVLDESGSSLSEFISVGLDDATIERIGPLPQGHGILGLLIVEPRPLRLPDLSEHPDSYGFPPHHPPMTTFLGVPLHVRGEVFGNLYLTEKRGGGGFTEADEELAVALAAVAGVAIENTRLHERLADLLVVQDRERIARELHDTVIQRLFATGLSLAGLAGRVDDPELALRLQASVDDLDDTVRHIRTTIFELQRPSEPGRSVRRELLELVAEAGESLGFAVSTRFDGPVDTSVDGPLADHLVAVGREALANTVRHSRARRVDFEVQVGDGRLTLLVVDDGVGLPPEFDSAGHGLANLRSRAAELGGQFTVGPGPDGGCTVRWSVPLPPS